jgi:gluconate 2-dehydrogenase gamma chain
VAGDRTSRRWFLTSFLGATSSLLASDTIARTLSGEVPWTPGRTPVPQGFGAARYFTEVERRCVAAITARLIPSDDIGPGAPEAGVVDFIDNQLAGFYGRGDRWYMQGPFGDGTKEQGYQSGHPPAGLYRAALKSLDQFCREQFNGRVFADLSQGDQDAILKRIDGGELALDGVSAKTFFSLIRENTIEGFFCDPIYGGNRDMVGWKLVGFPGVRYDYRNFLNHNGAAISLDPVGLRGRPAWTVN